MAPRPIFLVRGRVVDTTTHRPLPGLHIRVYDKDLVHDDLLGTVTTDVLGDFEVCFFERDFKERLENRPEVYVALFDAGKNELARTKTTRLPPHETELYFPIDIEAGDLLTKPRITHITPSIVFPGTVVEIHGANFGLIHQDVTAEIGAHEALVVDVRPEVLRVRIPPERGPLEPVRITVAGESTSVAGGLSYGQAPRERSIGAAGAPATFSGSHVPGEGPEAVGVGQRVLIIMCYPSDRDAEIGGLAADQERQRQIDVFEKLVNPAFRQMSFSRTDFDFDYTEWIELPETDDFYFWRQSDIDAAQDALDNLPADATEEERAEAQAAVDTATRRRNLMQERNELYYDALKAAQDDGWSLTDYRGVMLCLATEFLRGQASGRWDAVTDSDGNTVNLAADTYLWIISYTAHWGRRIHEISHAIASPDLYEDEGAGIIADASRWDLMGSGNKMPLFSGHNMVDRLRWYRSQDDVADPAEANVKVLNWMSSPTHEEVYTLRTHDSLEDNRNDVYHVIKLTIFPGLTYFVEVRQEPATLPSELNTTWDIPGVLLPAADAAASDPTQLLFDTMVDFPGTEPAHKGGVIVTKVVADTSELNQRIRRITLLSPQLMQVGDEVVDAARRLTIRVESKTADRPLTYTVRVQWVDVAVADPAGLFTLMIRPWDASWQTNDIWVDSEANGWDSYETAREPITGNPLGNGDRPWVGHWNRLYARVYNYGIVDASDVQVTFYVNSPPAIGDRGTWVPHAVRTIPAIPAGNSEAVSANWFPQIGEHTCIKVAVETQLGEAIVDDNEAQENVFDFDTSGSSPHQPIELEVSVQNPLSNWALVYLHPRGIPPGWEATVENGWMWLPPLGARKMQLLLFTDIGRTIPLTRWGAQSAERAREIPKEISFKLEGATYRWYGEGPNKREEPEHLAATGGIQIKARARRLIDLSLRADSDSAQRGRLVATGEISPEIAGVGIKLKITDPNGRHCLVALQTSPSGRYSYDSAERNDKLRSGDYRLQAFVLSDPLVADAESELLEVRLIGKHAGSTNRAS